MSSLKYTIRRLSPGLGLWGVLLLTFFCYRPGLDGGFLFDDFPNLETLGTYGGVHDWETFINFLTSGAAGPTGRPISLLSFLIDANNWPTSPEPFKYTNLQIHLLCGALLFWTQILFLRLFNRHSSKEIYWVAFLSSSLWLLHPYFVSTTLYVVQRMAQLTTLFTLIGLILYLHGRSIIQSRPTAAYIWMSTAVILGTLLATLSKENGVLLPLLILTIEFSLHSRPLPLSRWWQWFFLYLPSISLVIYLLSLINLSPDAWPQRPFNQEQRLLTEPRIILEYIRNLLIPTINTSGLFQDGFAFSTSLTNPPTTLISIIILLLTIISAFIFRHRWPLFTLATLFFFTGHLIESSLIGLELYFEHRNYLPTAFLFLPIASALVNLKNTIDYRLVIFCSVLTLCTLGFLTYQRARSWGDTDQLQILWALQTPESPRARNALAEVMLRQGRLDESIDLLQKACLDLPNSALLSIRLQIHLIIAQKSTPADFSKTAAQLRKQPFDAQAVKALDLLVETIEAPNGNSNSTQENILGIEKILNAAQENQQYFRQSLFQRFVPYLRARVYMASGRTESAFNEYKVAMNRYGDTDAALSMVAQMAQHGHINEALQLLYQAKIIFRNQPEKTLKRSRTVYNLEFERLEKNLIHDKNNLDQ